jgi:hypothetical protein
MGSYCRERDQVLSVTASDQDLRKLRTSKQPRKLEPIRHIDMNRTHLGRLSTICGARLTATQSASKLCNASVRISCNHLISTLIYLKFMTIISDLLSLSIISSSQNVTQTITSSQIPLRSFISAISVSNRHHENVTPAKQLEKWLDNSYHTHEFRATNHDLQCFIHKRDSLKDDACSIKKQPQVDHVKQMIAWAPTLEVLPKSERPWSSSKAISDVKGIPCGTVRDWYTKIFADSEWQSYQKSESTRKSAD